MKTIPAGTEAVVYSETSVRVAAPRFAAEVPFQLALVEFEDGERALVRVEGEPVAIGDRVQARLGPDGDVRFRRPRRSEPPEGGFEEARD